MELLVEGTHFCVKQELKMIKLPRQRHIMCALAYESLLEACWEPEGQLCLM